MIILVNLYCNVLGITLTKNETEDVIKVIRYLDNRIIFIKSVYQKN